MTEAAIANNLKMAVADFCGDDPGRSVAVSVLQPISLRKAIRADTARPAASVIKLALAMAVLDRAQAGNLDLRRRVPVAAFTPTRYASVLAAFDGAATLGIDEILKLAVITSDNPLAVWLTNLVGMDAANAVLRRLGCSDQACMGAGFSEAELGPANRANVLTATDGLAVLTAIESEKRYRPLKSAMTNNLRNNRMPALLDDDVEVAHKTGSLDGVVNDIGLVRRGPTVFAAAFLTDNQADPLATARQIAETTKRILDLVEDRSERSL